MVPWCRAGGNYTIHHPQPRSPYRRRARSLTPLASRLSSLAVQTDGAAPSFLTPDARHPAPSARAERWQVWCAYQRWRVTKTRLSSIPGENPANSNDDESEQIRKLKEMTSFGAGGDGAAAAAGGEGGISRMSVMLSDQMHVTAAALDGVASGLRNATARTSALLSPAPQPQRPQRPGSGLDDDDDDDDGGLGAALDEKDGIANVTRSASASTDDSTAATVTGSGSATNGAAVAARPRPLASTSSSERSSERRDTAQQRLNSSPPKGATGEPQPLSQLQARSRARGAREALRWPERPQRALFAAFDVVTLARFAMTSRASLECAHNQARQRLSVSRSGPGRRGGGVAAAVVGAGGSSVASLSSSLRGLELLAGR